MVLHYYVNLHSKGQPQLVFSNPIKFQTKVNILATFLIKLELLEKWTIKFPINWHSGSSLLRRPTIQRTAPASFSNPAKYQTQVHILATFSIKLELLEKSTIKFPINWHSGSSLLRQPTFYRTSPASFSYPVKYQTKVNILATFII